MHLPFLEEDRDSLAPTLGWRKSNVGRLFSSLRELDTDISITEGSSVGGFHELTQCGFLCCWAWVFPQLGDHQVGGFRAA